MKGIFEFESGGKTHGFKFGTMALGVAEDTLGVSADQVLKRAGVYGGQRPSVMALLAIFYGAAVQYCDNKKIPIDFTKSDVSDWLDDLGVEKVTEIFSNGINQYVPKNSVAPEKAGAETEAVSQ
jgi:hypothetical protein